MFNFILAAIFQALTATSSFSVALPVVPVRELAKHEISLDKRTADAWTNRIFKENILLTIAYGRKIVSLGQPVDWDEVNKPFHWSLELVPGKIFAFHNMVLPKYASKAEPWSDIHFYTSEGFLSDGWLIGDGVCHLASLMEWTARDAGLAVEAPTNHDFAAIPEVPKEHGVAIYYAPLDVSVSGKQNLYIQNNREVPVEFVFDYDGTNLQLTVEEL